MPTVRGCQLPDELLYDVENNIWYRENADGTVTVGMTAVAVAMAGQLVAFTPKRPAARSRPGNPAPLSNPANGSGRRKSRLMPKWPKLTTH